MVGSRAGLASAHVDENERLFGGSSEVISPGPLRPATRHTHASTCPFAQEEQHI